MDPEMPPIFPVKSQEEDHEDCRDRYSHHQLRWLLVFIFEKY